MKSSPYIGIFRHAPPEWQQHWQRINESMNRLKQIHHQKHDYQQAHYPHLCVQQVPYVDGRLLGGAAGNDHDSDDQEVCCVSSLQSSSTSWLDSSAQVSNNKSNRGDDDVSFSKSSRRHYHLFSKMRTSNYYCHLSLESFNSTLYRLFDIFNESELFSSYSSSSYTHTKNNDHFYYHDYFGSINHLQKAGADLLTLTGTAAVGGLRILLPMVLRRFPLLYNNLGTDTDNEERYNDHSNENHNHPFKLKSKKSIQSQQQYLEQEEQEQHQITSDNHPPSFDVLCSYEDQVSVLREARLDYVITQVDITRMAKNASRHLDVESILALPTVTYQSSNSNHPNNHQMDDDDDDDDDVDVGLPSDEEDNEQQEEGSIMIPPSTITGGWSWQMIAPHEKEENIEIQGASLISESNSKTSNLFIKPEEPSPPPSCVICLENFCDGDTLRSLPCGHLFHVGCIDHWLLGTYSEDECFTTGCPTCKKRPTAYTTTNANTVTTGCTANLQDNRAFNQEVNGHQDPHEIISNDDADGSLPAWAFARLGDALLKESFMMMETVKEQQQNDQPMEESCLGLSTISSSSNASDGYSDHSFQ